MQRKNALVTIASLAGTLAGGSPALAAAHPGKPLRPPAHGLVQVAFVVGPELVAIDLFGPWAAFGDAANMTATAMAPRFNTYTVAASTAPLDVDGGMQLVPKYSFENAPQPHVLVVPQQRHLPATIAYLKRTAPRADVTMSVCVGAFLIAEAGLLDGLKATTHHGAYDDFERLFPKVTLVRGPRYVENPSVSTSGGESSGVDVALRVVERYYGIRVANDSAYNMEYRRTPRPKNPADVG